MNLEPREDAAVAVVALPRPLRTMINLPWPIKKRLIRPGLPWRYYAGLCRRLGWGEAGLGFHVARNGPYEGIRLRARHINHLWVPVGAYEPAVSHWLVRVLTEVQWGCVGRPVWDVGAHTGVTALLCARRGSGPVLALEPNRQNGLDLVEHLGANPALRRQIEYLPFAAADIDGEIALAAALSGCESQLDHPDVVRWAGDATLPRESVRAVRLDALLEEGRAPPGLLKIDVEGAEGLVLAGAARLLAEHGPVIVVEVHNRHAAQRCAKLLVAAGYRLRMIDGSKLRDDVTEDAYGHWLAVRGASIECV